MKKILIFVTFLGLFGCDGHIYKFNLKKSLYNESSTIQLPNNKTEQITQVLETFSECKSLSVNKDKSPNTLLSYQCKVQENSYKGYLLVGVGNNENKEIEIELIDFPWQKRSVLSLRIEKEILVKVNESK